MERLLGRIERVIYELDRTASLNITTIARVRGPLTEPRVRAGLDALAARHPYLRARITPDPAGRPVLRTDGLGPSLRTVAGSGDNWIEEVDREVNEPIAAATGPILRCVLITHAADEHTLLLTFHHCLGDGMSGAFAVRDLVQAMAGGASGAAAALAPLSDMQPLDDCFPAPARGWSGRLRWARFFLAETWKALRHEDFFKLRRDQEAFSHSRRARLLHRAFDEPFTARLLARCRAERTTVQGAISAAILLGLLRDAEVQRRVRVAFGCPMSLRKHLDPPVAEDFGFYISMLAYVGPVGPDDDFWTLARTVRDSLTAAIESGRAYTVLDALASTFRAIGGLRLTPRVLAERWEKAFPTTAALTNLGRLEIDTRFGDLAIQDLHVLGAPAALGDFFSAATSLNGRLYLNFIWTDPVFKAGHMQALVDDIAAGLRRAVDG